LKFCLCTSTIFQSEDLTFFVSKDVHRSMLWHRRNCARQGYPSSCSPGAQVSLEALSNGPTLAFKTWPCSCWATCSSTNWRGAAQS
jgi:hypothetical protein